MLAGPFAAIAVSPTRQLVQVLRVEDIGAADGHADAVHHEREGEAAASRKRRVRFGEVVESRHRAGSVIHPGAIGDDGEMIEAGGMGEDEFGQRGVEENSNPRPVEEWRQPTLFRSTCITWSKL